jgi:protein TonB
MWSINVRTPEKPRFKGTTLIDLQPDADKEDASKQQVKTQQRQETQAQPTPTPPQPAPPPPRPSPLPIVHPYYIPLTKEENDTADIGRMAHAGPRGGGAQSGSPGDAKPIGTAPDGSPLYAAEWYREPTNAELGFYLPKNREIHGSGLIACKTIDHHHVDDCVELGSIPSQSHLASAARQAAWQFLVRAPRLGGRELVGSWVRIRIDYDVTIQGQDRAERSDEPQKQPADSTYIPY